MQDHGIPFPIVFLESHWSSLWLNSWLNSRRSLSVGETLQLVGDHVITFLIFFLLYSCLSYLCGSQNIPSGNLTQLLKITMLWEHPQNKGSFSIANCQSLPEGTSPKSHLTTIFPQFSHGFVNLQRSATEDPEPVAPRPTMKPEECSVNALGRLDRTSEHGRHMETWEA